MSTRRRVNFLVMEGLLGTEEGTKIAAGIGLGGPKAQPVDWFIISKQYSKYESSYLANKGSNLSAEEARHVLRMHSE